ARGSGLARARRWTLRAPRAPLAPARGPRPPRRRRSPRPRAPRCAALARARQSPRTGRDRADRAGARRARALPRIAPLLRSRALRGGALAVGGRRARARYGLAREQR